MTEQKRNSTPSPAFALIIFAVIIVVGLAVILGIMLTKQARSTLYHGIQVLDSKTDLVDTQYYIDSNADWWAIGGPPYETLRSDDGRYILKYYFYAENDDLLLEKGD